MTTRTEKGPILALLSSRRREMQRAKEVDTAGTAKRAVASNNPGADGKRRRLTRNLSSYEESDDDDIFESDLQSFVNAVDELKAEEEKFHQRQQIKFLELKSMICDMRDRRSRRKWKRISHAKKELEALMEMKAGRGSRDLEDDVIEDFDDGGRVNKFGDSGKNGGGLKEYARSAERERVEEGFGLAMMGNKSSTAVSSRTLEVPREARADTYSPLARFQTIDTESQPFNTETEESDTEESETTPAQALPNKTTAKSPRNNPFPSSSVEIKMEVLEEAPDFHFGTPSSSNPDIQQHIADSSPLNISTPHTARTSATSLPEAHTPVRRDNSTHENSRPSPQMSPGNCPFGMGFSTPRLKTRVRRTENGTAPLRSIGKKNYQEVLPEPPESPIHPTKRRKRTQARRESSSKNGPDDSYTEDRETDKVNERVARPEKSSKKLRVDPNQSSIHSYFQRTPVKRSAVAGPSGTQNHPSERENPLRDRRLSDMNYGGGYTPPPPNFIINRTPALESPPPLVSPPQSPPLKLSQPDPGLGPNGSSPMKLQIPKFPALFSRREIAAVLGGNDDSTFNILPPPDWPGMDASLDYECERYCTLGPHYNPKAPAKTGVKGEVYRYELGSITTGNEGNWAVFVERDEKGFEYVGHYSIEWVGELQLEDWKRLDKSVSERWLMNLLRVDKQERQKWKGKGLFYKKGLVNEHQQATMADVRRWFNADPRAEKWARLDRGVLELQEYQRGLYDVLAARKGDVEL
ncbi:hypothetical protein RUND412_001932 [Rhizina undulata]